MSHMLHKADGDDGLGGSADNGDRRLPVAPGIGHRSQPSVSKTGIWWLALATATVPTLLRR